MRCAHPFFGAGAGPLPRPGTLPLLTAVLAGCILLLSAMAGKAVTPGEVPSPRATGGWVTDMAGVVRQDQQAQLNRILADLEQDTGVEIAVVTVPDTGEQTPKDFATDLFNRWGVGKRGLDNGVLILLAVGQRRIEVETGYGIEPVLPDGRVGALLDRYALPSFRQGDYGTGLLRTVEAMAAIIREEYAPEAGAGREARPTPRQGGALNTVWNLGALAAAALALYFTGRGWRRGAIVPDPGPRLASVATAASAVLLAAMPLVLGEPATRWVLLTALLSLGLSLMRLADGALVPVEPSDHSRGTRTVQVAYWVVAVILGVVAGSSGLLGGVVFGGAAIAGWYALRRDLRSLPRRCPRCSGWMRWLSEEQEAAYLEDARDLEQELGSVDYDVWRCDACQETEIYPHYRPWSPYTRCPRCGYRTLATEHVLVRAPDYEHDGLERVTQRCRNCGFTQTRERRLPRRPPPTVVVGGFGGTRGGGGGWSGGGGFGGGSSGGGGAGRSW